MNVNDENAQKLIVIAAIITVGSTTGAYLKLPPGKGPLNVHRAIFGGFFAMFICSVIAGFDSKLGVTLAGAVAGGTFINYGLPVINSYFEETPQQKQNKITEKVKIKEAKKGVVG